MEVVWMRALSLKRLSPSNGMTLGWSTSNAGRRNLEEKRDCYTVTFHALKGPGAGPSSSTTENSTRWESPWSHSLWLTSGWKSRCPNFFALCARFEGTHPKPLGGSNPSEQDLGVLCWSIQFIHCKNCLDDSGSRTILPSVNFRINPKLIEKSSG